jgi:hypothetical protein
MNEINFYVDMTAHVVLGAALGALDRKRSINGKGNTDARIDLKKRQVVALEYLVDTYKSETEGKKSREITLKEVTAEQRQNKDYLDAVAFANELFTSKHKDVRPEPTEGQPRLEVNGIKKLGRWAGNCFNYMRRGYEFNGLRFRDKYLFAFTATTLGDLVHGISAGTAGVGNGVNQFAYSFLRTPAQALGLVVGVGIGSAVAGMVVGRSREEKELDNRLDDYLGDKAVRAILRKANESYAIDLTEYAKTSQPGTIDVHQNSRGIYVPVEKAAKILSAAGQKVAGALSGAADYVMKGGERREAARAEDRKKKAGAFDDVIDRYK